MFKKIISSILAVSMLAAMSTSVFAATDYSSFEWGYFFESTSNNVISSPYGDRNGSFHNGIDVINSNGTIGGTKIISVTSGTVARVYLNVPEPQPNWSMGYAVSIKTTDKDPGTGKNFHTLYMHMKEKPLVNTNSSVSKGTALGYVGSTGQSTGNHLHFQVTNDGSVWASGATKNVNPTLFFSTIFSNNKSANNFGQSDCFCGDGELVPMEFVELVGWGNFEEWVERKNASEVTFKFDINEYMEYFGVTDVQFSTLVQNNSLSNEYNLKELIDVNSIV